MMASGDAVLAIDIGTTTLKAAIVDAGGGVVWQGRHGQTLATPQPGWAEQDASAWWPVACGLLADAPRESVQRVAATSVTGHNPTLVCIGPDLVPRRPAITWADTRATAEARTLSERIGRPIDPSFNVPKAMWLATHEPSVLADGTRLLQSFDYLACRLTGTPSAISAVPGWPAWDMAQVAAAGLQPALVPPAAPPLGSTLGVVSPDAARETGLVAGRPVITGLVDGLASWIGAGALDPGDLAAGAGTSSGVNLCWPTRLDDPQGRVAALPHPFGGGRFMPGGPMSSGSRLLDWLAHGVCHTDVATLIAEAATIPPGADGVLALPYLSGERTPFADPQARGVFVGLALAHSRAHLARAALEAIAFAIRDVMDVLLGLGGAVRQVRVGGGGSASDTWNQIKADVLKRPVIVPFVRDTSLMGVAAIAAWGAGLHASGDAATRAMVRTERVFEPATVPIYDDMFERFRATYRRLRPEFGPLAKMGASQ